MSNNLTAFYEISTSVAIVAYPVCTWLFNRLGKARQLETHATITAATIKAKDDLKGELANLTGDLKGDLTDLTAHTDKRFDELQASVARVDAGAKQTALDLAHLRGRFDQAQTPPKGVTI